MKRLLAIAIIALLMIGCSKKKEDAPPNYAPAVVGDYVGVYRIDGDGSRTQLGGMFNWDYYVRETGYQTVTFTTSTKFGSNPRENMYTDNVKISKVGKDYEFRLAGVLIAKREGDSLTAYNLVNAGYVKAILK